MTAEEFDELRRSAFVIAYRMLGSVSEAGDMVQDGLLHLHRARAGGERIASPRAGSTWARGSTGCPAMMSRRSAGSVRSRRR
jgi:DNA-directed RNA polymerase specialized sigma24 family protein